MKNEDKIINIINALRPFLINDGGNIEFIKLENNIVYIKMLGSCANCQFVDYTIADVIFNAIQEEIPEIEKIINISE